MQINGISYSIIDELEALPIQDCFVRSTRTIGKGHGEGKFYIGSDEVRLRAFFGDSLFNIENPQSCKCFVTKFDLAQYVEAFRQEFTEPNLPYHDIEAFRGSYDVIKNTILDNPDVNELITFEIIKSDVTHKGIYVNSTIRGSRAKLPKDGYEALRRVVIPIISSVQIYKLKRVDNNSIVFYWRPFPDYEAMVNPSRLLVFHYAEERISAEEKNRLICKYAKLSNSTEKSFRKGQAEYRRKLFELFDECPITRIKDPKLLVASHIKPWAACKGDKLNQRIDEKNGFLLSPLIDKLFDRGLIKITEDGKIEFSQLVSIEDQHRCGIDTNVIYFTQDILEDRREYLEYHRTIVFHP